MKIIKELCPVCQGKRFEPDGCAGMLCGCCWGSGELRHLVPEEPKEFRFRFEIAEPTPGMPPDWIMAKGWSDYPIGRAA